MSDDPMTSEYVWKCTCGHYEIEHKRYGNDLHECLECDCEGWFE